MFFIGFRDLLIYYGRYLSKTASVVRRRWNITVCCLVKMTQSVKVEFLYTRNERDSLSHTIRILLV